MLRIPNQHMESFALQDRCPVIMNSVRKSCSTTPLLFSNSLHFWSVKVRLHHEMLRSYRSSLQIMVLQSSSVLFLSFTSTFESIYTSCYSNIFSNDKTKRKHSHIEKKSITDRLRPRNSTLLEAFSLSQL